MISIKMVVSRMGRSTDGKFVHRVIPFVLERELHSDKAINLLPRNFFVRPFASLFFSYESTQPVSVTMPSLNANTGELVMAPAMTDCISSSLAVV